MTTHVALDEELIEEARQLGGIRTKKDVIRQALVEYVQRRKQMKLLTLFGSIELDDGFDYNVLRQAVRVSPSV